jgi:hypothetical protein
MISSWAAAATKAVTAIAPINMLRGIDCFSLRCADAKSACVWLVARTADADPSANCQECDASRCLRIRSLRSSLVLLCKWRDFRPAKHTIWQARLRANFARGGGSQITDFRWANLAALPVANRQRHSRVVR